MEQTQHTTILLTGATGYVGGRLLRALEAARHPVRCLARSPEALQGKVAPATKVVPGDLLDEASLQGGLQGIETAYYLVHSMAGPGDFEELDRRAAHNFAAAAQAAGLSRIIYLGGLAHGENLSEHLASRIEVGQILRASGVPTIEFRASVIIGADSLSFEMVRTLVDRLPVMFTPRWVSTLAQPIYIDDVIAYLVAALDLPPSTSRIFEIGGPERVSYRGLMRLYAQAQGLRRLIIPVPILTPWLSSLWLGLITPAQAQVGRKLIEGVRNDSTVRDNSAAQAFPHLRPRPIRAAVAQALAESG